MLSEEIENLIFDTDLLPHELADRIFSIPITVPCDCDNGITHSETWEEGGVNHQRISEKCPHCDNGQRTLMKVKKCDIPHDGNFPNGKRFIFVETEFGTVMKECSTCKGTGIIKEPLTLADIDWDRTIKKDKLVLKDNWKIERAGKE